MFIKSASKEGIHTTRVTLYGFGTFTSRDAIARSVVMPLGMQEAPRSIPAYGTFFHEDFGHENISTAILPLPLIQEEQLSVNGERKWAKYW